MVALVALLGVTMATAGSAVAAPRAATATSALTTAVTGTFTDALGGVGTATGTFTPTRFISQNGQLSVVGTLTSTLIDSTGTVVGTVTRQVTTAVTASGSCTILHLTLGPLDLNLLGLMVHLDRVVLDITAQSGPGWQPARQPALRDRAPARWHRARRRSRRAAEQDPRDPRIATPRRPLENPWSVPARGLTGTDHRHPKVGRQAFSAQRPRRGSIRLSTVEPAASRSTWYAAAPGRSATASTNSVPT